jgi:hypothetical protein
MLAFPLITTLWPGDLSFEGLGVKLLWKRQRAKERRQAAEQTALASAVHQQLQQIEDDPAEEPGQ